MANKQPSDMDRMVAHGIVGLGVGTLVGQKAGVPGFIVAAIVAVVLHAALDAPVAGFIADIS